MKFKKLKNYIEECKEEVHCSKMGKNMQGKDANMFDTFAWIFLTSWASELKHKVLYWYCTKIVKKHDWVDESYGGPEGGCESGYCKRCGFSFHHTMY